LKFQDFEPLDGVNVVMSGSKTDYHDPKSNDYFFGYILSPHVIETREWVRKINTI